MLNFLTQDLYETQTGEAILTLENPGEPYLGGVRYNVQVPGKKCVAMDCLSGGEAAMASLSFLFALIRYCMYLVVEREY
jgi:structural maintenance of chromosome 1